MVQPRKNGCPQDLLQERLLWDYLGMDGESERTAPRAARNEFRKYDTAQFRAVQESMANKEWRAITRRRQEAEDKLRRYQEQSRERLNNPGLAQPPAADAQGGDHG